MALPSSMFTSDLLFIEGDIPQTFGYAGLSGLPCVASEYVRGGTLEMDGVYADVDQTLVVRRAVLTAGVPKQGDPITQGGRSLRVARAGDCEDGVSVNLWLVDSKR